MSDIKNITLVNVFNPNMYCNFLNKRFNVFLEMVQCIQILKMTCILKKYIFI